MTESANNPGSPKSAVAKTGKATEPDNTAGGRSQSGLRNFNERVIMSLIRRAGALPKTDIAAATGLSAQAVTVIINKLESEGLLRRLAPQRGRVGQPSVPFALNPCGAYAYGVKIGRRSYDLTLLDFEGKVQGSLHENCRYPTFGQLISFVDKGLKALTPPDSAVQGGRLSGMGIALPYELWNWSEEIGAPAAVMNQWRHIDLKAGLAKICSLPIYICNDDTAACAAELLFGNPKYQNFLYIYIGSFVGGGVVINGELCVGSRGNAGAIGSLPVPVMQNNGQLSSRQLISLASIRVLEKKLADAGMDPRVVLHSYDHWVNPGPVLDEWIAEVAAALAHASASAVSLIDFEAIVIDGHIPVMIRHKLVERLRASLAQQDFRGLCPVEVVEGLIGSKAQSIGSAALPFLVQFGENNQLSFDGLTCATKGG